MYVSYILLTFIFIVFVGNIFYDMRNKAKPKCRVFEPKEDILYTLKV